jgi:hypothetical protein
MSAPHHLPKSNSACHSRASPVTRPSTQSGVKVKLLRWLELDEHGDDNEFLSNFSFVNQPLVISSLEMTMGGWAACGPLMATVHGLYSSWSYGLRLVVVAHANFGGITTAIHLITYQGMADSCFMPHGALA